MAQCKVWLDNYNTGRYYPGSQIQGKVVLYFNSETTFRSIKVKMFGREHTEWMGTESYTEHGSNETKTRDVRLWEDNDVISTELILHGGHSSTSTLPAGQHMYPFSLILPNNIPSTYDCEFGSITYKVVAIVDRPMAFDYEDQFIFVVVSLVDLNSLRKPELLKSTSYSEEKTVCCWCCAQGPITMDITLPKRTLVVGETLNIPVRITNMSNTNVERLELELTQTISCKLTASVETKAYSNTLVNLSDVGVGAHGDNTFTFAVQLPENCAIPNFTQCKLFTVTYKYRVTAKLPGVHSSLSIEMYPEVGNIEIGHQAPQGGFGEDPNATYPAGAPTYPAAQYPPANGPGYPSTGGPGYPPIGGEGYPQYPPAQGVYPAGSNQQFSNAPGVYPPQGYPSGAYQPPPTSLTGYSAKAQEAAGYPSAPAGAPSQGEQLPPSYDSVLPPK